MSVFLLMKDKQMEKKKGFTLIELLVVIAIIALLLAILMPALNSAKGRAMKVVCLSNMKGSGLAFHAYAASSNDRLPIISKPRIDLGAIKGYYPYFGLLNVWGMLTEYGALQQDKLHCPADKNKPGATYNWFQKSAYTYSKDYFQVLPDVELDEQGNPVIDWSYYYNIKMYSDYDRTSGRIFPVSWTNASMPEPKSWRITDAKAPAQLISFSCFNAPNIGNDPIYAKVMVHSSSEANNGHQAGFLDGHSEWVTMDRIKPRSVQNTLHQRPDNTERAAQVLLASSK
jgi:prepilin-type N-terminal cleavage/methylation domain-containing protein